MKAQMYNYSSWIEETNSTILFDFFMQKLNEAGFGVENVVEKHFNPQGYTSLFLLSESHFAIHTFPEENKTYIELSSCVKDPFDKFIKSL
jgi:S-adenosylmethionine/arginine decarboxylase-like enzyme